MYNIFDLSDFLFFWFCSSFIGLLYSLLKTSCYFSKSLEHIHDHGGNLTWMLKTAFVVVTTTQKLQFTLKNVSSRPSHLSNWEILYIYIYIRYVSLTITHAYALCAWVMSSDFDDSEGCS